MSEITPETQRIWDENNYAHWRSAENSAHNTLAMAKRETGRLALKLMNQLPLFDPEEI